MVTLLLMNYFYSKLIKSIWLIKINSFLNNLCAYRPPSRCYFCFIITSLVSTLQNPYQIYGPKKFTRSLPALQAKKTLLGPYQIYRPIFFTRLDLLFVSFMPRVLFPCPYRVSLGQIYLFLNQCKKFTLMTVSSKNLTKL